MSHFEYMVPDEDNELAETSRWCGDGVNGDDENDSVSDTWKEDHSMEHEPPNPNEAVPSVFAQQAIFCILDDLK
jgi:hypothetical protein